jgi:hypothetical protein
VFLALSRRATNEEVKRMQLKRLEDVQWLDLPKIESPHLAGAWVESHALLRDSALWELEGLDDVVWDDLAPSRHVWDATARIQLLERVERAEVVLVHGLETDPVGPALLPGSGEQHDNWTIVSSLSPEAQYNLRRLLEFARATRTIREPIIAPRTTGPAEPAEPQQAVQLSVTNPRWEHVDQQRSDETPDSTIEGDTITLNVDVNGASDGTLVTFRIYETSQTPPSRIGVARGKVEGGVGTAQWEVNPRRDHPQLEFEGAVRRVSSGRAEIVVLPEFEFSL